MSRAPFPNEDAYDSIIRVAAANYGVPFSLVKAMVGQESRYDPRAYRPEVAIGDASIGLMQILYRTAKGEGYTGPVGDKATLTGLYDPMTNITYGTSYLARQIRATGSTSGGVSAYNGGYQPNIGFGAVAKSPVRVCLRRDIKTGNCVEYRNVPAGEYANQSYVNDVLWNMAYYEKKAGVPPSVVTVSPPLDLAPHDTESQNGGRDRRTATRSVGTHAADTTNALIRIFAWLLKFLRSRMQR